MRDGPKIAAGLALFLGLALSPVWQRVAAGRARQPEPVIAKPETRCLASREVMRASHMRLLDEWRQAVVREGRRSATDADGRPVSMSLTGTCLECHSNKKDFCDRCHLQLVVKPVCWGCHAEAAEKS
jgi:hypothetical protein